MCTDIGLCRVLASSTVFWSVMRWIRGGWSLHSSSSSYSGATRDRLTIQTSDNMSTSRNILSTSDTSILASSNVDIGITSCVCVVALRHRIVIVDALYFLSFFSSSCSIINHQNLYSLLTMHGKQGRDWREAFYTTQYVRIFFLEICRGQIVTALRNCSSTPPSVRDIERPHCKTLWGQVHLSQTGGDTNTCTAWETRAVVGPQAALQFVR